MDGRESDVMENGKFGCWEFDGGGIGLNEKMKEKPTWKSAMGATRGWHDNPSTYMTKNVNWWEHFKCWYYYGGEF